MNKPTPLIGHPLNNTKHRASSVLTMLCDHQQQLCRRRGKVRSSRTTVLDFKLDILVYMGVEVILLQAHFSQEHQRDFGPTQPTPNHIWRSPICRKGGCQLPTSQKGEGSGQWPFPHFPTPFSNVPTLAAAILCPFPICLVLASPAPLAERACLCGDTGRLGNGVSRHP